MKTSLFVALIALFGASDVQSLQLKSLIQKRGISNIGGNNEYDTDFLNYVSKYQRNYKSKEEYEKRKENFRQNMEKIKEVNSENDGDLELGVTKFTDLSKPEFQTLMGLVPQDDDWSDTTQPSEETQVNAEVQQLPASVDWRTSGAVSSVKNQYSCGSCYAFSALGAIEGLYHIKNGRSVDLSEQ